ncbi:MAG: HAD-IIB family hydrolase [Gammaproteobacteria bacterium]|nr:HAD-IIB family hydrolase [Gammaproteobacteria bacterium]
MNKSLLVCTDLDRTLLPNGSQPESDGARGLFKRFCSHPNIELVYVSGRDKSLLLDAISQYDLPVPDYAIGDVGTSIYKVIDKQWAIDEQWLNLIGNDWGGRRQQDLSQLLAPITGLRLQEPEKQNNYKLSYYVELENDPKRLIEQIDSRLQENQIESNIIWSIDEPNRIGLLDILPRSADKLTAIRFLADKLPVDSERVIFSGDSGNDLSVLTSELKATLVANAAPEVVRQAKEMTQKSNTTDQLYFAKGTLGHMNGNYASGILEGIYHYFPDTRNWIDELLAKTEGYSSS